MVAATSIVICFAAMPAYGGVGHYRCSMYDTKKGSKLFPFVF